MGWELTDLRIIEDAGNASVFAFEITLDSADGRRILTGDGLVLEGGQVRINRAAWLKNQVAAAGFEPEAVLAELHASVAGEHYAQAQAAA